MLTVLDIGAAWRGGEGTISVNSFSVITGRRSQVGGCLIIDNVLLFCTGWQDRRTNAVLMVRGCGLGVLCMCSKLGFCYAMYTIGANRRLTSAGR